MPSTVDAGPPALLSGLALHGGAPTRGTAFPPPPGVGPREAAAVQEVMESGVLSSFTATWGPSFDGGPRVRALERAFSDRFGVRHAVAMNSATSALNAAVAAAGAGPGDEVIVSPYTMTASATCALVNGAVPVFADVELQTGCLDVASVVARTTERTRAIVVVDLFGCPADVAALRAFADARGIVVVEDAAQAPGASRGGRPAGTLGHIGVFSLNYHKTIQCGEGGVAVTDDTRLAERLRLVRNHGEAVVGDAGLPDADLLGFNYRLGELEAAIAAVQLERLDELTAPRVANARRLSEGLAGLDGVHPPTVPDGVEHVFYQHVVRVDPDVLGVSRASFARALQAEGLPVVEGYVAPLYRLPLYRARSAAAFTDPRNAGRGDYGEGVAPVCERLHDQQLLHHPLVHAGMSTDDVDDVVGAFRKVHAARGRLEP